MAIFLSGRTQCRLTGRVLRTEDNPVMFSRFVANELDPAWLIDDAVVDREAFEKWPHATATMAQYQSVKRKISNKICEICGKRIETEGEHVLLPYFSGMPSSDLYSLNHAQFHEACLRKWPKLSWLRDRIIELHESGAWGGPTLPWLIREFGEWIEDEQPRSLPEENVG